MDEQGVRDYSHVSPTPLLDDADCNALLLTHWSVHQKLNQVSSAQFSYVALYTPLCHARHCINVYFHTLLRVSMLGLHKLSTYLLIYLHFQRGRLASRLRVLKLVPMTSLYWRLSSHFTETTTPFCCRCHG